MQKYHDTVQSRNSGRPVSGASVLVKTLAGVTATIYSDNGVTPASNPLTTDANGYFSFYAADGRYTLTISGAGIDTRTISDVLLEDPADNPVFDAANVAITGGTINGVAVAKIQDPSNVAITGGAIGGISAANIASAPIFFEDFRRANTTAPSLGAGWTLKGAYVSSYPLPAATTGEIANNAFTNAGRAVVYAMRTLRTTPRQFRCRWSWKDLGTGSDFTVLAMIVTSSATNLIDTMLHVTMTNSQLLVQKRISGGAFVNLVAPVVISPSIALVDTPHVATITINGASARVQIDDAVDVTVTDSDIPSIVGPTIAVEHYTPTTSVRYPMSIYEVSAYR